MTTTLIAMFEGGGDCSSYADGFNTAQNCLVRHQVGA